MLKKIHVTCMYNNDNESPQIKFTTVAPRYNEPCYNE